MESTIITRKNERKPENLKKLPLIELKEILERQQKLLRNKHLMNKLPDKGESIKVYLSQVESEMKYRQSLEDIQELFTKIDINDHDKHIRRLCEIEKPEKVRYKPFATLNKVKEVPANSKVFKLIEDCTAINKPTKLILLPESLEIQIKQDDRVKDEQVKNRYNRLLHDEESDESDSEQLSDAG